MSHHVPVLIKSKINFTTSENFSRLFPVFNTTLDVVTIIWGMIALPTLGAYYSIVYCYE